MFEILRAGDEARTRDNQLGRLELYQLSYSRKSFANIQMLIKPANKLSVKFLVFPENFYKMKSVNFIPFIVIKFMRFSILNISV